MKPDDLTGVDPFTWADEVCRCLRDLAPRIHPTVASATAMEMATSGAYVGMVPREAAGMYLAALAKQG
jgi:DNA-binding transcriptional LysR family regulator